ncbi:MAG: GreA/GreB family elongation factor [Clostridia bacterium]|nr:GreA/GreB family elongation factor [Clostridia bacterium]
MKKSDNVSQEAITLGCVVKLHCMPDDEYIAYRLVKSRDAVESKPVFTSGKSFSRRLDYEEVIKFAEYADDELGEDRPLAQALIGKKLGESCTYNEYTYKIEKIIFPDGRTVEIKKKPPVLKPAHKVKFPCLNIDFDSSFAKICSDEELQIISDFAVFMADEFPKFESVSKMNRVAFTNPDVRFNGIQYSQFWFVKRGGSLYFRFKLNQNDNEESKYSDNILAANRTQLNSIKTLVRLILTADGD